MWFFTSDLHFNHKNIIVMQNRPFNSIEEMNQVLIDNINYKLKPYENSAKLAILGDLSHHCCAEDTVKLISQIKCKEKYLVIGNHDKPEEIKKIAPDLFVDIQPYMEVYDYNHNFVLCHYPILSWKKMRGGWIHLHGHSHNKPEYNEQNKANNLLRLDVGVEAWNYFPISSKQIIEYFGENALNNPNANYH